MFCLPLLYMWKSRFYHSHSATSHKNLGGILVGLVGIRNSSCKTKSTITKFGTGQCCFKLRPTHKNDRFYNAHVGYSHTNVKTIGDYQWVQKIERADLIHYQKLIKKLNIAPFLDNYPESGRRCHCIRHFLPGTNWLVGMLRDYMSGQIISVEVITIGKTKNPMNVYSTCVQLYAAGRWRLCDPISVVKGELSHLGVAVGDVMGRVRVFLALEHGFNLGRTILHFFRRWPTSLIPARLWNFVSHGKLSHSLIVRRSTLSLNVM